MELTQKVKEWYQGRHVPPPPPDPGSRVVFFDLGHYDQPAAAKWLGVVGRFWLAYWQWIIGTAIAIVGLLSL
jgi:hypothetical protein